MVSKSYQNLSPKNGINNVFQWKNLTLKLIVSVLQIKLIDVYHYGFKAVRIGLLKMN